MVREYRDGAGAGKVGRGLGFRKIPLFRVDKYKNTRIEFW